MAAQQHHQIFPLFKRSFYEVRTIVGNKVGSVNTEIRIFTNVVGLIKVEAVIL